MKHAKNIFEENSDSSDTSGGIFWMISEEQIKEIQYDAFRQGVTWCADFIRERPDDCNDSNENMAKGFEAYRDALELEHWDIYGIFED